MSRSAPGIDPVASRAGGQATVETALVLPVLVLAAVLVWSLVAMGRDQVALIRAAGAAARAASVEEDPEASRQAAVDAATRLDPARLRVEERRDTGLVTITLTYETSAGIPLIGGITGRRLVAEATYAIESG